jgi:hypothetical protein
MSKATRGTVVSLAAVLLILSVAPAGAEKMLLDASTFVGTMTENGKTRADEDQLVFKDGKFRSTVCDAYGFTEAPYSVYQSDVSTGFEAEAHSPKEGTMKWKGTVKGNTIEGTADWVKKGQADAHYTFKGKLKE